MQRETVYTLHVDRPRDLTKQEAIDLDKSQPWRRRIPSGAMDEINALKTILLWADEILKGGQTAGLLRDLGAYRMGKAGVGLLKAAVEKALEQISAVQLRTLDANWRACCVTLSAAKPAPGFVNVDIQALETLINQTLVCCRDGFCAATDKESLSCPVREALDSTINAGRAIRTAGTADAIFNDCPYAMNRAESRILSD